MVTKGKWQNDRNVQTNCSATVKVDCAALFIWLCFVEQYRANAMICKQNRWSVNWLVCLRNSHKQTHFSSLNVGNTTGLGPACKWSQYSLSSEVIIFAASFSSFTHSQVTLSVSPKQNSPSDWPVSALFTLSVCVCDQDFTFCGVNTFSHYLLPSKSDASRAVVVVCLRDMRNILYYIIIARKQCKQDHIPELSCIRCI